MFIFIVILVVCIIFLRDASFRPYDPLKGKKQCFTVLFEYF